MKDERELRGRRQRLVEEPSGTVWAKMVALDKEKSRRNGEITMVSTVWSKGEGSGC